MGILRLVFTFLVVVLLVRLVLRLTDRRRRLQARSAPRMRQRSPHEVLGVSPQASQKEIQRAYQERIRKYHPDRVSGMADEIRELAERRSKEINQAYDALKRT